MNNYIATGYKPGRPRKGEVRPESPSAIAQARYRSRRLAREPEWREKLAEYQLQWRANNPEKAAQQSRDAYLRAKRWKQAGSYQAACASGAGGNPLTLVVYNDHERSSGHQCIYSRDEDDQYDNDS